MKHSMIVAAAVAAMLARAPGIFASESGGKPVAPSGQTQVDIKSRFVYSAEENRPATGWLLERAREPGADNGARLDKLIRRWPDVTLEILRQGVGSDSDAPARLVIAKAYDRLFAAEPNAGWAVILEKSKSQKDNNAKFRRTRDKLLAQLQSGQFTDAARLDPLGALSSDAPILLRAEALRAAGLAALLNEKLDKAADFFGRAVASAQRGPSPMQFELGILASETERRRNKPAAAAAAWKTAVAAGASPNTSAMKA